jgi:ABC-2 type transport system ATP-binding protein
MSPSVVEVRNLTKRFGAFTAVDGISFDIGRGEILGLLGPNGAGKTTTFQMMLGLSHPVPARSGCSDSTCRPIGRRFFSR